MPVSATQKPRSYRSLAARFWPVPTVMPTLKLMVSPLLQNAGCGLTATAETRIELAVQCFPLLMMGGQAAP